MEGRLCRGTEEEEGWTGYEILMYRNSGDLNHSGYFKCSTIKCVVIYEAGCERHKGLRGVFVYILIIFEGKYCSQVLGQTVTLDQCSPELDQRGWLELLVQQQTKNKE